MQHINQLLPRFVSASRLRVKMSEKQLEAPRLTKTT